jgi:hypothetical protein
VNVVTHLKEAHFFLRETQRATRKTKTPVRTVLTFEKRLAPHLRTLLDPTETTPENLFKGIVTLQYVGLLSTDYCLLRINHADTIKRITDALIANNPADKIPVYIKALCHAATSDVIQSIAATQGLPESVALQLTEALAFAGAKPDEIRKRIKDYLHHKDPILRRYAWRVAQLAPQSIAPEEGLAGVLDDDHDVRCLALETVAWSGQPQLLDHCRRAAAKPTGDNLPEIHMLAALATQSVPEDGQAILTLVGNKTLNAERCALAGTLGRPEAIETLLEGMESPSPLDAQAAGDAFARITGCTLRTDHRATLPPADSHEPDEVEKKFLEEADIPDADDAKEQWNAIKANFAPNRRYSGGVDITDKPADWSEVDMQSRWEYHLRTAYYGKPHLTPVELEQFPLRLDPAPEKFPPPAAKQDSQPESLAMQFIRKRGHP